jgi:large subunit ribosomal protein L15
VPKRGFNNRWARTVHAVNVGDFNDLFNDGDEVTLEVLRTKNLSRGTFDQLKVLGNGELTKKLKISAHRFSKSALEKIQQSGSEAIVLPAPAPVVKNVKKTR